MSIEHIAKAVPPKEPWFPMGYWCGRFLYGEIFAEWLNEFAMEFIFWDFVEDLMY